MIAREELQEQNPNNPQPNKLKHTPSYELSMKESANTLIPSKGSETLRSFAVPTVFPDKSDWVRIVPAAHPRKKQVTMITFREYMSQSSMNSLVKEDYPPEVAAIFTGVTSQTFGLSQHSKIALGSRVRFFYYGYERYGYLCYEMFRCFEDEF